MRHGVVYLTEDRKRDGLFAELDVIANATAPRCPVSAARTVPRPRAGTRSRRWHARAPATGGSEPRRAGRQAQRRQPAEGAVRARAADEAAEVLVCDEPTRGVDVGAKAEIHEILRNLAAQGVAVLVISSEFEELLALAHRIVVMHERRFVAEMPADQADEAKILIAASGSSAS